MDGPINGGMMYYYEVRESKLARPSIASTRCCGVRYSPSSILRLGFDLDRTERHMMIQSSGDFARFGGAADESHNVSMGGDFDIQVYDLFDVIGFGYILLLLMMFFIVFEFAKVVVVDF
ncbi:hypothetical protein Scep_005208 [Stephania cephalantha]|uniref:Uncharacterized protein n=1 Tax=Stephania cephalantha TaxID=152367 RepID=A0AAP0PXZ5_9MAGN